MQEFFSNGKLLLTGEYLVLHGAEALALPLKLGQRLQVAPLKENKIHWETYYKNEKIFECIFSTDQFNVLSSSNDIKARYLQKLLIKAFSYKGGLGTNGYTIKTMLDFPFEWGLGSSSSLINNLSKWLKINPYRLNHELNEGSGYDIACAESHNPIIYKTNNHNPEYHEIEWDPPYKDNLYFIYTGKKQNSASEVKKFTEDKKSIKAFSPIIKKINSEIINSSSLEEFEHAISEHEQLLSGILDRPKARDIYFSNFPGQIKSLGAWGGDFILVTWRQSENELNRYLKRNKYSIFFPWKEVIKTEKA